MKSYNLEPLRHRVPKIVEYDKELASSWIVSQISFYILFLPTEVAPIFSNLLHVFWNGQGLADNISSSHFLGAVSSGDWAVLRQVETSVPTPSEIYGTPNFWRIRCKI